jgi:hypothetical protein
VPNSSWGEWHYFNLVTSPDEWWYITYRIEGELSLVPGTRGRWGGRLLVTHRRRDGSYERFRSETPLQRVAFDTARADVRLGPSFVRQRDGIYHLRALARGPGGQLRLDAQVVPEPNWYFPPVEFQDEGFVSGYVVPGLVANARGTICMMSRCSSFSNVPAYHDHNWGVWRDVAWEWGAARGTGLSLLYGGVYGPARRRGEADSAVTSPFFLTLWDSLGVKQVLRFNQIDYEGSRPASGAGAAHSPARIAILATREYDTLRLDIRVADALATEMQTGTYRRTFIQMRGKFTLTGRALNQTLSDSGKGFFETYLSP